MTNHTNLIERLNRKHRVHSGTGGGSISYDKDDNMVVSSYVTDDGMRLVNPDGPEAAQAISTLTAEVERMGGQIKVSADKLEATARLARSASQPFLADLIEESCVLLRATLTKGEGDKDAAV